jgi:hypothetical protein
MSVARTREMGMGEACARFVIGGVIVSLFALIGEAFKPKTFAGLFGSAPSVAIATLALTWSKYGPAFAAAEARTMMLGAVGLFAYDLACVWCALRRKSPVWLGAAASWAIWVAVAFGALFLVRKLGGAR